jgi:hypothetical protein
VISASISGTEITIYPMPIPGWSASFPWPARKMIGDFALKAI